MLVIMITIKEGKKSMMVMKARRIRCFATPFEERAAKEALNAIHSMRLQEVKNGKVAYLKVYDPSRALNHE